jgi:hypothetical protein
MIPFKTLFDAIKNRNSVHIQTFTGRFREHEILEKRHRLKYRDNYLDTGLDFKAPKRHIRKKNDKGQKCLEQDVKINRDC